MLRAQLELSQLKQEIERKLNEKDDELEAFRSVLGGSLIPCDLVT